MLPVSGHDQIMLMKIHPCCRMSIVWSDYPIPIRAIPRPVWRFSAGGSSSVRAGCTNRCWSGHLDWFRQAFQSAFLRGPGNACNDNWCAAHWTTLAFFRFRLANVWIYRLKVETRLNQYHLAAGESVLLKVSPWPKTARWHRFQSRSRTRSSLHTNLASRYRWTCFTLQTFQYTNGFKLREELLDEKSIKLFHARSLRTARTLSRLCFILAVTTLVLTVQGQEVVAAKKHPRLGRCSL